MRDKMTRMLNNVSHPEVYEEVIIQSNNVPIALSLWKSNKEDPSIVFFPGTMSHPLMYDEFLSLLSSYGYNVIGVHPVCHGKSPRVKKIYSFEEMLQNGKDAISYAIERFNDNVSLMGSSQGGILTIALAGLDHRIKAAFPHNILIPDMPSSICVTRFPNFLKHFYKVIVLNIRAVSALCPRLQIPLKFYLDEERITKNREIFDNCYADPIGFMSYPIYFLSSLFSANLKQVYDGSIKCPIVVIASKGDPLFPLEYTNKVFDMIKAPYKEMLLFDLDKHLIMNECVDEITEKIAIKVKEHV